MWATIVNILLGLWLMISPELLQYESTASHNNYILGPLVITFSITAIWELNRFVRLLNIPAGIWLVISPFILNFQSSYSIWISVVTGILIVAFSLMKGRIKGNYGGGWRSLFEK